MATSANHASTFAQRILEDSNLRIGQGVVMCRQKDGYINATALCHAGGKKYGDWYDRQRIKGNHEKRIRGFLDELASVMVITITDLIDIKQGGIPDQQGTWVHPCVAIDIAYWISAEFAVKVTRWVMTCEYSKQRMDELSKRVDELENELETYKQRDVGNNRRIKELEDRIAILVSNEVDLCRSAQDIIPYQSREHEIANEGIVRRCLKLENETELVVEQRAIDCYVNITAICRIHNSDLYEWKRLPTSKKYINIWNRENFGTLAFDVQRRGVPNPRTFAHPDIAIQIAQWCNPYFAIQVSRWVREPLSTGKVELGKEMKEKELMKVELENIRRDLASLHHTIQEKDKKIQDLNDELYEEGDIYVIRCKQCDNLYVGSSKDAESRFKQHMHDTEGGLYRHFLDHGRDKLELCPPEHHRYHIRDGLKALEQRKYDELVEIHGRDKMININNPVSRSRSRSTSRVRV